MEHSDYRPWTWFLRLCEAAIFVAAFAATSAKADEITASRADVLSIDSRHSLALLQANDATGTFATGTTLILAVRVNGVDRGLAQFRLVDGTLWVARDVLAEVGVRLGQDELDGAEHFPLEDAVGDSLVFDEREQSVAFIVAPDKLAVATSRLNFLTPETPVSQSATGALVNYDLYANMASGSLNVDVVSEARFFSGNFLIESTGILRTGSVGSLDQGGYLRLDTVAAIAWPEERLTLRAGDVITRGANLSRPTRLGGLRLGTDFSLQPYFVTTPLPSFFGEATLPSTVDLYIEGVKRYSGEVTPGPFEIGSGPTRINGAGRAEVVVTDVLGQVSQYDYLLYDTPRLLRDGLVDWSVEIGAVRRGYGLNSFGYEGDLAASLTYRQGVTGTLTLEGHSEFTSSLFNATGGAVLSISNLGVASGSGAVSFDEEGSGYRFEVGYSYSSSDFFLSASLQRASEHYADIAANNGAPVPREQEIVTLGYSSDLFGNFGASVIRRHHPDRRTVSTANISWSRSLSDEVAFSASANVNFRDTTQYGAFFSLTWRPRRGDYLRASWQTTGRNASYSAGYRRSVPYSGGVGWAADVAFSDDRFRGAAQVDHLSSRGQLTGGVRLNASDLSGYAGYSGAVVWLDDSLHLSRKIYDGFALVKTDGVADVPVSLNNRTVGRTSANGTLLVTGLNSYQTNQIAIDSRNLPAEIEAREVRHSAVPSMKGGALVAFNLRPTSSVLLSLLDVDGSQVSAGSIAWIEERNDEVMFVGFDGMLYIEHAVPGSSIVVETNNGLCYVTLPREFPAERAGRLGEQTCLSKED